MRHGTLPLIQLQCGDHNNNNNNNNTPAFIHALWIADPSKRATGRNMQPSQRRHKGDLNAVCDRQQARADPLLFTKRPATLTCPGVLFYIPYL